MSSEEEDYFIVPKGHKGIIQKIENPNDLYPDIIVKWDKTDQLQDKDWSLVHPAEVFYIAKV